ncbi:MAG: hypothetical protein M5U28_15675 [Sandaracinaceae bacterium]|nr:hypothetical protein [Sandaracinaceae bacterium]
MLLDLAREQRVRVVQAALIRVAAGQGALRPRAEAPGRAEGSEQRERGLHGPRGAARVGQRGRHRLIARALLEQDRERLRVAGLERLGAPDVGAQLRLLAPQLRHVRRRVRGARGELAPASHVGVGVGQQ